MATQYLTKDGRKIGEIQTDSNGRQILFVNGQKVGEYDPRTNVTMANGRRVGEGNLLASLITS